MNKADFTYGINAEKERDLSLIMAYFKHLKDHRLSVRVVAANSQEFSMRVTGFDLRSSRVYFAPFTDDARANRVIIPVEYIISAEVIAASEVDTTHKGQFTLRRGDFEDEGYVRSGRDFFQAIRFAHQRDKSIRVYLSDNRVLEGVSTGINAQSAGIRLTSGKVVQVFYDWVDRVVPL